MTVHRRNLLLSAVPVALAAGFPSVLRAQALPSIEGRYETLPTPQPTTNPDKVEVVEIFWYGCPHCNRFQPYIDPWQAKLPEHVEFVRLPAIFRKDWEVHARAYYTSVALGALNKTHAAMFGAIHGQQKKMATKAEIQALFTQQGVDAEEFEQHYESFGVDSGVRRSKVMQERYGIRGVPAVVVNGKYRITASLAGSYPEMVKVIDALVAKEHQEMLARK
ncbi:MAG: thiol:disulfide interchange protein DsbA [Gammaproteobacteria bacterium]|jgi:thiol:disulfide interchange protein DsbA